MDMGQQWNHIKYTNHYKQWSSFLDELKRLRGPIETITIPVDKSQFNDSSMQVYVSPFTTLSTAGMNSSLMASQWNNTDFNNMTSSNFNNNSNNSYNNTISKSTSEKKSSPFQISVKVVGMDVRMKTASRADNSCIALSSEIITCDGLIEDDCDVGNMFQDDYDNCYDF